MRALILIAAASLGLAGCNTPVPTEIPVGPAPLSRTTIDEQALIAADRGFDVALDAINLLIDAGVIKPGTPRAIAIARAVRTVDSSLALAARLADAGNAPGYLEALRHAMGGITELRSLLKG